MKKYIGLIIFFTVHTNYAEEFIYPVASFDNGNQLMVLHQKSLDDIELLIWNSQNQTAKKGLSSFLTPGNLRMLPSGKGFSFIDSGYIKIKEFAKRSPRTLPIYEPIGLFSNMDWIDDETFYFVAQQGNHFQIFRGNVQAQIEQLTCGLFDALYPQMIGSQLFYMQRDMHHEVKIMCKNEESQQVVIIQNAVQQACYLKMINESQGFYMQAPTHKIEDAQGCYEFSCHRILKNNDELWQSDQLFTFKVPAKYITGSNRLYESIEPFLPNYSDSQHVYFCDWNDVIEEFQLHACDITTKNIKIMINEQVYKNKGTKIFAPYLYKNKIYCGIIIEENRATQNIFEMDNLNFILPCFNTKE
jgi:hypothetical protein